MSLGGYKRHYFTNVCFHIIIEAEDLNCVQRYNESNRESLRFNETLDL